MTATVLSPAGEVLFRVRRPLYLINSRMAVEDAVAWFRTAGMLRK